MTLHSIAVIKACRLNIVAETTFWVHDWVYDVSKSNNDNVTVVVVVVLKQHYVSNT